MRWRRRFSLVSRSMYFFLRAREEEAERRLAARFLCFRSCCRFVCWIVRGDVLLISQLGQ